MAVFNVLPYINCLKVRTFVLWKTRIHLCHVILLQATYNSVLDKYGSDVSARLNRQKARKVMYRARHKNIPPCPKDLVAALRILDGLDPDKSVPPEYTAMYQGSVSWLDTRHATGPKLHHAICISDEQLMREVCEDSTFFWVDGTFKVIPRQALSVSKRGSQVPDSMDSPTG